MPKIKNILLNGFLIILLTSLLSFDKPKLTKTKVADGITVSIPKGWRPMDGLDFTERYPSVRAPLAAYTDEERLVDFSINVSATQWPDKDIELAQKFFRATYYNMFDRVEMIREGIQDIRGKKFIYFEFDSRVNGKRTQEGQQEPILKYTYIQYLIEPGRTLVFSFNCPQRQQKDWQETARVMMKSLKMK